MDRRRLMGGYVYFLEKAGEMRLALGPSIMHACLVVRSRGEEQEQPPSAITHSTGATGALARTLPYLP